MRGNTICKELLKSQGYYADTVTASAFIQQREKILSAAFEFLLDRFVKIFYDTKGYRGYRFLAVDSSSLRFARDPNNPDIHFQNNRSEKGY
jgi:hypothetical protein